MNTLSLQPLTYHENLIDHYGRLAAFPGFVLLDSCGHQQGRYDIVSALPYECVSLAGHAVARESVYSDIQSRISPIDCDCSLPFQGGAIGYFSYDFGAELQGIQKESHPDFSHIPKLCFGFYDWAIISDHHLKKVTLVSHNPRAESRALIKELIAAWDKPLQSSEGFHIQKPFRPCITKDDYQKAFDSIHKDLFWGRSYQVNYTQAFTTEYQGDPFAIYKKIRSKNPVPYAAFMRIPEVDFLSFSPERFITYDSGTVLTSPIKGSAQRSSDPKRDMHLQQALQSSEKNRAENIMIVDLLRNDLGKIAKPGSVKVNALCELQSFNAVHHLVSEIKAKTRDDLTPVEIFAHCFPGGSITGAPKREAMRIISEHELYARGLYCGSLAYFSSHGRFDSNIAIRTMTAAKGKLLLAAGGGIVMESSFEEEYQECYTKLAAIINALT